MHLLVIGAGTVGRHIASTAASFATFTAITVADIDLARAQSVAGTIGAAARRLDASDRRALVAAMREADIVVSAIGPATRFGVSTLAAAIEAGRPYAEISDDPYPMLEMLAMSSEAQAAGITAIVGLGASPGVASLLAVEAGRRLSRVDRILTGWGQGGPDEGDGEEAGANGEVTAALEHWVEQTSGAIPILRGGAIVQAKPLEPIYVDYPGIGHVQGRTVGHPEPVTLQRRFPSLRESVNVMDFSSYVFAALEEAAALVEHGASAKEAARRLVELMGADPEESIFSRKAVKYAWHEAQDRLSGKKWLPELWALAEGDLEGRPARIGVSLVGGVPGGMGAMTGIPAAIALTMLAEGKASFAPGVHAVETVLDSVVFFERLHPFLRTREGVQPGSPYDLVHGDAMR